MSYSRRDLSLLLPALLAAAEATAQDKGLPSKIYRFEELPVKGNGPRSRAILDGKTYNGYPLEVHATELAPGLAPHPPHHHEHEEMFLMREGTLEATIAGKVSKLSPGSVAYVHSNEEHGVRNAGTTTAHYFVIALGSKSA